MEIVLIVGFLAVVVVGNKLYKKRLAHMTPKAPTAEGVNGTFGGGSPEPDTTPRHDDGSVTPPTKEGQNEM